MFSQRILTMKNGSTILILGNHPLANSIERQFASLGCVVIRHDYNPASVGDLRWDELVLLPTPELSGIVERDNAALSMLEELSSTVPAGAVRRVVHLLLSSQASLWMLQTMDFSPKVNESFEVYPFTVEDMWAKNIFVQLPGIKEAIFPTVDRVPINADSRSTVHVVISGFDAQAEAVAIHAALIAHYPNYRPSDEMPLRTRITIIDKDIEEHRDRFIAKYQYLFNNSYYRSVDLSKRQTEMHYPQYKGKRMDFVDVEWEFVKGSIVHTEVVRKINQWVSDGKRQLTFVVSHNDDERNLSEALSLPMCVYQQGLPVFVRQCQSGVADSVRRSADYANVFPFGMIDRGYDVTLPLVKLAKMLKYFYDCSYDERGVPTELPAEAVEKSWMQETSFRNRFSCIYNVMTISAKMRILGHDTTDANTFYALTQSEIQSLAETEHNRWSVERLIQGFRPCTDQEVADVRADRSRKRYYKKRNIHYDLRAYDELEDDETGKNAKVYDYDLIASIPLMIKAYNEQTYNG